VTRLFSLKIYPKKSEDFLKKISTIQNAKKIGSFSLIERVILSAGAMLIFSVSFQIDQMPEGGKFRTK
jgi:hypothetical protein